jgi:chromate transport protein ChrA
MHLEKADRLLFFLLSLLSSLSKEPITYKQLFKEIWYLGFIAYGGPLAHIAIFKKKFVDELQW